MEFRKDLFANERDDDLNEVGQPTQRQDALGHVTGRSRFFDDHAVPGMLHMKFARSPHHHARIRSMDVREAAQMPGVVRVLTSEDVPKKVHTLLILLDLGPDDEPPLAFDKVRYRGEPVAAVIAETESAAAAAAAKVRVDYEPLPSVFDVEEALEPGAPLINEYHGRNWYDYNGHDFQKIRFGDVERAFREADHVIEERYQMTPIEHAPTETGGCIAAPDTAGRYVCYTNTQALFFSLETAAQILKVPSNRLHFVGGTVGGGFGGKVDSVHEPLAILGAMLTQRPVRSAYSRAEEMQVSSPRGAERFYIKDGVMNDGRIVARSARIYFDAGAYSRLSPYGAVKAAAHMPGPYYIPNVWVDARCVYTNRTPSSAMRGFGVTGADFALEVQMDKLAPGRHGPHGVPDSQRVSGRRHEGAPAGDQECGPHRVRPGRGPARRLAALGTFPGDVLDARRRRRARRNHADTGTGNGIGERFIPSPGAACRPRGRGGCGPVIDLARCVVRGTAGYRPPAVPWREGAGCRACWERGGVRDDGEKTRARDRIGQLPDRHEPRWGSEPGARALQPRRQVHRRPLLDRSGSGDEECSAADLRGSPRRPGRGCLRRHRRLRHRAALHGQLRLARDPPGRQRAAPCSKRRPRSWRSTVPISSPTAGATSMCAALRRAQSRWPRRPARRSSSRAALCRGAGSSSFPCRLRTPRPARWIR